MYNIKKKNIKMYKIYKKIRIDKKWNTLLSISYGVDSNFSTKDFKNLNKKKLIKLININHKSKVEKDLIKNLKINIIKLKLKLINKKQNEKELRKKRFKKLKNICIKKKSNIWIFQQKNEILENFIIQKLIKNEKINKISEIKKKYLIKKIKPLNKIKKKYIKYKEIKNKNKWFEESSNIKYKNIRNKLRINLMSIIKIYVKNFKNLIKVK